MISGQRATEAAGSYLITVTDSQGASTHRSFTLEMHNIRTVVAFLGDRMDATTLGYVFIRTIA